MAGAMLRTVALLLRFLQFCCAITCMGIFSYFIAVLGNFSLRVLPKWQATEALVVLATAYTLLAILLVLCLAGSKIFGIIAILLDLFFVGAFIAVAWFTRHGAYQCNGLVQTPVGDGLSQDGAFGITNTSNYRPKLGTACRLNRAVFALAIISIFLFLATAILQVLMSRSKKDKRYTNDKDYDRSRSSKTPSWKRNHDQRTRSRSSSRSRRRSHRDKDLAVAGAGVGGATAARGLHGHRSGDSGSTLDDNNYNHNHNRVPKHHESGYDRPGHTPITGRGHHHNTARDGTYPARDDGTYTNRNDPNDPIHSVTVHSPTTTTTTTTHMPPNPVVNRDSSRGRRGGPGYTEGDAHGNTHVPGFNTPLTQHTPYHEITTQEALRNQNAAHGQPGYNQNIVGGQRDYDNTNRGQNILPGHHTGHHTGHGMNTVGHQGDYDNRGQPGYDQNIPGSFPRDVGNQRDYDNTTLGRHRDITPGRDTTLGRDRDITPGRVRDVTPGRTSNRNTITNSRDYDNTNLGQTDYGRDNTFGRDRDVTPGRVRDVTPGRDTYNRTNYNPNTNQGYNDSYNQDSSFNRTPSAGRVRRF